MAMVFVQTHSLILLYFVSFHLLYANNTTTISPTSSPTPSPTQQVLFTLDQDMALLFLSLFIVLIAGICCCGSVMVIFAFFSFRLKRHEKLFSHQLYEEALSDGSNKSSSHINKTINIKILDPTKKSTSISNEKSQSYEQQLKDKKQELSVQSQSSNADNDQDKEQKEKKHKKHKKDKKDKDRRRDHHKKDRKKDNNRNRKKDSKKDNKKHHKKSHKKVQKIDKNENKDSSGPSPSPNPNNIGNKNDKDDIMSQNTITTSAKAPSMVENINPFYHQQQQQQQIQLQTINNNQIHKSTTSMLSTQISNTGISLNRIPTNASNDSIVDHDHDTGTNTTNTTSIHNIDIMSTSTHTTDLNSSSATTTDDGSSQPIFKLPKKVTKGHWM